MLLSAAGGLAGVAVLRLAWAQPRRSAFLNTIGWAILVLALLLGASMDGAWGVTVAALVAMAAASAALAVAAWTSPKGRASASARRANMLPEAGEKKHIGRRIGTFLLVGVGAMFVSFALAVAIRGLGGALGWSEADSNAAAVFAMPIVWGTLAYLILMQERRRAQLLVLLVGAVPALPALVTGFVP